MLIKLNNKEKIKKPFDELRIVMIKEKREKELNEKIEKKLLEIALNDDSNIDFELGDLGDISYLITKLNDEDKGLPF